MRKAILAAVGAAICGLTATAGDEMSTMRTTMDNMKQEMEAMRATMASEREDLRANAGGAPEALKSANGKATVKIGGDFKIRYSAGWASDYNNATSPDAADQHDNTRYTRTNRLQVLTDCQFYDSPTGLTANVSPVFLCRDPFYPSAQI